MKSNKILASVLLVIISLNFSFESKIIRPQRRPPIRKRPPVIYNQNHYPSSLICAKNEVYTNCTDYCVKTCDQPDTEPCNPYYCNEGCICRDGFVRDENNTCVPIESCLSYQCKYKPNEHWNSCGQKCEPSCTNYQSPPTYCLSQSCKKNCFCDYGLVRDYDRNGLCVKPSDCTKKCGPNEIFSEIGLPCYRSQANPHPDCLDFIINSVQPLCICKTGYTRNANTGVCDTKLEFDTKCGKNETFSTCNSSCGDQCWTFDTREKCPTFCQTGCFCNEGFVRQNGEQCILVEECDNYNYRPRKRKEKAVAF